MTLWSKLKAYLSGWPEPASLDDDEEKLSGFAEEEQAVEHKPHLQTMTKKELDAYGRTIGIEVDRRHKKSKIIKTLQSSW